MGDESCPHSRAVVAAAAGSTGEGGVLFPERSETGDGCTPVWAAVDCDAVVGGLSSSLSLSDPRPP